MSQDLTNGMEKETLTPEQLKEQKAIAKAESIERGLAYLTDAKLFGEEEVDFVKVVELAKNWGSATVEERTEMRNNFKETFAEKAELKKYVAETLPEQLAIIEDIATALGTVKSAYNGIKRLGVAGKVRISKKDMQLISHEGVQYQVRKVDIIESQSLPREEKIAFLLACENTVKVEVVSFDAL